MVRRGDRVRWNLSRSACPAVVSLAAVMAIDARQLAGDASGGGPWSWLGLRTGVSAVAGVFFFAWLTRARSNAESYGPAPERGDSVNGRRAPRRVGAWKGWEVRAWLIPFVNVWAPYQVTAGILRASSGVQVPAARDTPGMGVLRVWWGLWLSMWAIFWASVAIIPMISGITSLALAHDPSQVPAQYTPYLWGASVQPALGAGFDLLSMGAAACAIAVIIMITRRQVERARDPVYERAGFPRAVPAAGLTLAGAAVAGLCFVLLDVVLFIVFFSHGFMS